MLNLHAGNKCVKSFPVGVHWAPFKTLAQQTIEEEYLLSLMCGRFFPPVVRLCRQMLTLLMQMKQTLNECVLIKQYVVTSADSQLWSVYVCTPPKNKTLFSVIRTRSFERPSSVGRADKSVWCFPSAADLSFPHSARADGRTGSDYLIVTSSMCSAQHPERGWHFSCPKGHAEWAVYQWGGIYASLGRLVTNRCCSLAA